MFPNDTPTLSLDSTTLGSSMAISDAEGDEEAPFMSYFPNGDALGADPEPDTDLLSLGTDCKLSANAQAEIATTDLSSSFLWTRDETTMCPDPSREDQKLDIPALTDLFQDLGTWLPKKPPPANLELTEGIRLPAPLELSGSGGEECFVSFPNHCCCEGERGVSGRMMGGLIRVAIIKECELGMGPPFLLSAFVLLLFFLVVFLLCDNFCGKLSLFSLYNPVFIFF